MGDFDDFGELYADLENREIGIVLVAEEEEVDKDELEEKGDVYENGAVESLSSSDSEVGLQIVLNEEDFSNNPPFQLITSSRNCGEDDGDDLVVVTDTDCYGKELKVTGLGQSVDGLFQVNRARGNSKKGVYRNSLMSCSPVSAPHSWNFLFGRGHWDHFTVPCSFGNLGFSMAFPNVYDFYLPRNRSIFDIDVESFEHKPWRFNGVDITDYFNFGLDEEGWRTYCKQLVLFHQNNFPVLQSSEHNKPTGRMSGEVAQHGHDNGPEISSYLHSEKEGIIMPKGRAI